MVTSTVWRETIVVPGFFDHLLIADGLAGVAEQDAERRQPLRAQPDVAAVA